MMRQEEEKYLIASCLEGEIDAFGDLVGSYQEQLYATAFRVLGNHADAADLLAEKISLISPIWKGKVICRKSDCRGQSNKPGLLRFCNRLNALGITSLDYSLLTHNHQDHLGNRP